LTITLSVDMKAPKMTIRAYFFGLAALAFASIHAAAAKVRYDVRQARFSIS
jgi:hypothetical protein